MKKEKGKDLVAPLSLLQSHEGQICLLHVYNVFYWYREYVEGRSDTVKSLEVPLLNLNVTSLCTLKKDHERKS